MTDQCNHCTLRGNFDVCHVTDCYQHESWYTVQLIEKLSNAQSRIAELEDQLSINQGIIKNLGDKNELLAHQMFVAFSAFKAECFRETTSITDTVWLSTDETLFDYMLQCCFDSGTADRKDYFDE